MFGLSTLWLKIGAVVAVIVIGITAIYIWRADIRQAAYDAIFREQVEAHLKDQDEKFKRLEEANKRKDELLKEHIENQRRLAEDITRLEADFRAKGFKNSPIDPGLRYTLEQIKQLEDKYKQTQGAPK